MITAILIVLILASGLLGAYTMNFQQTTLTLGKRLLSDNPFLPTGFQDSITPKVQTARNIIWPILIGVVFVYGLIFYKWYWGIGFAVLTFIIVIPILKLILPRSGSDFYKERIKRDLLKRLAQYKKAGDDDREEAMTEILTRFDKLE
jgi:hypothetical protein